jgi:hypothetical protein
VQKTLKRLEEKVTGKVLSSLLCNLRPAHDETTRQVVATALAHLCSKENHHLLFKNRTPEGVMETLLKMVTDELAPRQRQAAKSLSELLKTAANGAPLEVAPSRPNWDEQPVSSFVFSKRLLYYP